MTFRNRGLWEVDAERVDLEAVEEAGKALIEARQALVHDLHVHEVGLEVRHAVSQLTECGLERIEWARPVVGRVGRCVRGAQRGA